MRTTFWRSKWFIIAIATIMLASIIGLIALRFEAGQREDAVLTYFSKQKGMPETFANLTKLTPPDSVVLCWWDYGRAVREWSRREVIEAYPSRDIWYTIAASRDLRHNLAAQLFGNWGSSQRIHDLAAILVSPEDVSLPMMQSYDVAYAVVFEPDDLQKFHWIAEIAGKNSTEYLTFHDSVYEPTELGSQTTLLRLIFDDTLNPQHFTKLFDNGKGKIYRVEYS